MNIIILVLISLLSIVTCEQHDNNLDSPFIPRFAKYSTSITVYFKIDFQEALELIVDSEENNYSVLKGAKPFYDSNEKMDVYYRRSDQYAYAVPSSNSDGRDCYKLEKPFKGFTLDLLERWWADLDRVKYDGKFPALYNMESCHVWGRQIAGKNVELFIDEVSNTPIQITENNPFARPEWRVTLSFHDFNTTILEPVKPTHDLSTCKDAENLSLIQLLPEVLMHES
ncbi:argS [Acrasis kona]|uniref:ArgS n=1 Tax=Acrasis kona TaxID=1008807 RepID=A0AAW2Z5G9_9EUKA